ncbi:NYN domain-containing protein [Thermomonospora catenispora]|uniref:NYN domain-containing protein n=1 Tax=Thermomonospora catenispora TaxID=2493090 RepID=UPI0011234F32|nr:NYN domain-containing protein [Thermomonospora catenispora]TNY38132.1 NYN domain-containing protein [Thermomonospora catenispora]
MDRCALFVDAGYLLADGAMAVHGTRHRETVSWDFPGLLQLLGNLGRERTGMPLLRCYWYEATVEGRRSPEHEALADLPGLKLRLGRIRPGRREGVDTEIHRDLMTLARNRAISDAIVVSGDEDLAPAIADVQDFGIRVTIVHVAVDGNWTISRALRQECDDLIEIGANHLRPYVNLLSGVDQGGGSVSPLSNGHGTSTGQTMSAPISTGPHSAPPPSSPITGRPSLGPASGGSSSNSGPQPLPSSSNGSYGSALNSTGMRSLGTTSTDQQPAAGYASLGGASGPSTGAHQTSGPSTGAHHASGPSTGAQAPPSPVQPAPAPPTGYGQSSPAGPSGSPIPTGPQQAAHLPAVPQQSQAPTLSDAVKAAHKEGQDFGESVARDAPALWLEAVLARKPRMPSDLEARLLQGSSLPIDFLLHDEVRHALRRGFWDALERSRR